MDRKTERSSISTNGKHHTVEPSRQEYLSRNYPRLMEGLGLFMPKKVTPMEKTESVFSIPQVIVICAFIASLVGLSGWILNLEIRKADRAEIIGRAYRENLERSLDAMQEDLRYIRRRVDQHIEAEPYPYGNGNGTRNGANRRRNDAQ